MEGSVYLKARHEWDEHYADLVLGKRNWQITAAGMMAVTLVLAFGMVWVSIRSKFVPYVVEVDKLGYALATPSALTESTTQISSDRMVCYELAAFVPAIVRSPLPQLTASGFHPRRKENRKKLAVLALNKRNREFESISLHHRVSGFWRVT
jgi:type IV secretory pathway TrbF-like protein